MTEILPEAPLTAIATIVLSSSMEKELAGVPPKLTAVTRYRLAPFIVTGVYMLAEAGEKDVITGGGIKVKPERVLVPLAVVTLMSPVAPAPTTALSWLSETMVKELAGTPPKLTAVAPVKPVPNIEITVPAPADVGEKEVSVGGAINTKPANVAVP